MSGRSKRAWQRASLQDRNTNTSGSQRGQVSPRLVLGAFVLIVISGPLVAVAVNIQSSLASTPAFSWLSAAVVAVLIVAAIAAAALGLD